MNWRTATRARRDPEHSMKRTRLSSPRPKWVVSVGATIFAHFAQAAYRKEQKWAQIKKVRAENKQITDFSCFFSLREDATIEQWDLLISLLPLWNTFCILIVTWKNRLVHFQPGFYSDISIQPLIDNFIIEYFKTYDGIDGRNRKDLINAYDDENVGFVNNFNDFIKKIL